MWFGTVNNNGTKDAGTLQRRLPWAAASLRRWARAPWGGGSTEGLPIATSTRGLPLSSRLAPVTEEETRMSGLTGDESN